MQQNAARSIVVAVAVLALVAGCAQIRDFMSGLRKSTPQSGDPAIPGAPSADQYLQELRQLASGDSATQAKIYADAHSAASLTPGMRTRLRYALVLATPGHPQTDLREAQSMLHEILTQSEPMTRSEIALVTIYLASVERMIALESEARRLRASTSRTEQTINERLASVDAENQRLRRELEDALEKLEAIQSIERSIREQE